MCSYFKLVSKLNGMGRACDMQRGEGFNRMTENSSVLVRPRPRWEGNFNIDLEQDVRMWTGFFWLRFRIGSGGRML